MLKQLKSAVKQAKAPVSVNGLLAAGFEQDDINFIMGDLVIKNIAGIFYYRDKKNKLTRINNMYTVARLVFGGLDYGR